MFCSSGATAGNIISVIVRNSIVVSSHETGYNLRTSDALIEQMLPDMLDSFRKRSVPDSIGIKIVLNNRSLNSFRGLKFTKPKYSIAYTSVNFEDNTKWAKKNGEWYQVPYRKKALVVWVNDWHINVRELFTILYYSVNNLKEIEQRQNFAFEDNGTGGTYLFYEKHIFNSVGRGGLGDSLDYIKAVGSSFIDSILALDYAPLFSSLLNEKKYREEARIYPDSYGPVDYYWQNDSITVYKKSEDGGERDILRVQHLNLIATDSIDNYVFGVTDTSFYYYSVSADKLSGPISIRNDWSHYFNDQRISEYDFKVRGEDSIVISTNGIILEEYFFSDVPIVYVKSKDSCFVLKESVSDGVRKYLRHYRYYKDVDSIVYAYRNMHWPIRHIKMGVFALLVIMLNIFLARGKF